MYQEGVIDMSSKRLTKYERNGVVNRLLTHKFGAEADALAREWSALARSLYDYAVPVEMLRKASALPANWFYYGSEFRVNFAGPEVNLYFSPRRNASYHGIRFCSLREEASDLLLPQHMISGRGRVNLAAEHALTEAFTRLHAKLGDYKERLVKAEKYADAMLNSHTTVSALLRIWPEVEPFVNKAERVSAPSSNLPAVQISELNALLGLPVVEEAL